MKEKDVMFKVVVEHSDFCGNIIKARFTNTKHAKTYVKKLKKDNIENVRTFDIVTKKEIK